MQDSKNLSNDTCLHLKETSKTPLLKPTEDMNCLELPMNTEDATCLDDFIHDDSKKSPIDLERKTQEETISKMLRLLTPKEQEIFIYMRGVKDGKPKTHEEICQIFNLTIEQIRKIETKALNGLRHPSRSKIIFVLK